MNARTGRAITGLAHLYQSIAKILTTRLGSGLQRRNFGSDTFSLIDAPNNDTTRVRLYAATAAALMRWEPRLKLTRVTLAGDSDLEGGQAILEIEGITTETGEPVSTAVTLR